ncbi:MAG: HAD-IB family hydrolase [Marinicaulis sp.]|nr:HAD-IB family hydrolase [Marinicaulis sp.]NNE39336.1 HAD-IB family hydrolase [Marinicaulis sp.]NNL87449.1 HAD-IB family hydrolase [Marinicaulis sp.]
MSNNPVLQSILDDIEEAPNGPSVAAIFDYDGTLIHGYSAVAFLREQIMSGAMSPREMRDQFTAVRKFASGKAGFSALMDATAGSMRGRSEEWFSEFGEKVYRKSIAGSIYPEARAIVAAHRRKGHTLAIISSATKYQIQPVADDLGFDNVLCTELEVKNGVFTGKAVHPTCFGEGKRMAAEALSYDTGVDLDESFFYTDSDDDLALLDVIGRPRILNANTKLKRIARQRGWNSYKFSSRGRPDLQTMMRMALAYYAMPASFALTSPILALTGNKRAMLNVAGGLWADYATAITGVELDVDGEENLWAERPAVFVFNHQSSLDALILPKLLRRDFTGVGKKEIARFPVIGQIMQFADVVLIDRKNTKKAIDAMRPVVDAIKNDGLSVSISPEGTRSVSTKLGKFKKGPFHIAMQAGVPMVPVVIHNATDSMPRGAHIARPAKIRVSVLSPVDTSDWSADTIDAHVESVRNMFLDALNQGAPETNDEISLDHWDIPDEKKRDAAE